MPRYRLETKTSELQRINGEQIRVMVWHTDAETDDLGAALDDRDNLRRRRFVSRVIDTTTNKEVNYF